MYESSSDIDLVCETEKHAHKVDADEEKEFRQNFYEHIIIVCIRNKNHHDYVKCSCGEPHETNNEIVRNGQKYVDDQKIVTCIHWPQWLFEILSI
jgi:hypothetical protein